MSRYDELMAIVGHDKKYEKIIEDAVFLEEQCDKLRQLPFLVVNKKNPGLQKATPAARQYRECLSQYTNIIRILMKATGDDGTEEESPLRKWINGITKDNG